jgi:hypothetical protein
MRIIIDVPERGSPETTMTGSPYLRRRCARFRDLSNGHSSAVSDESVRRL